MKMKAKMRKQAQKAVQEVLKPTYFKEGVPITELFEALEKVGVVLLQEDNTIWSGFFCGRNANVLFTLGDRESYEEKDGLRFYTPFDNAGLVISWYQMEGAKSRKTYEVIGYVS